MLSRALFSSAGGGVFIMTRVLCFSREECWIKMSVYEEFKRKVNGKI